MGWDVTGMNCNGMGWDRKICPMDKPAYKHEIRTLKSEMI